MCNSNTAMPHVNLYLTDILTLSSKQEPQANFSGRSCYLDLTPNSGNLPVRRCVAAREEN